MHKNLLVVLSLSGLALLALADDEHKQSPSRNERAKQFVARAYSATGQLTAMGKKPVAGLTIAADPRILAMGSTVRIEGAGSYSGIYEVGDTGGAIKGNKIDVFVRSRDEAIQFGRRVVQLSIVALPRKLAQALCKGCAESRALGIIKSDEAWGRDGELAGRSVTTGGTRVGARPSDSWKSGSPSAFYRLSAFEGPSSH